MSLYTFALFVHLVGVIVGLAGVCGWLFALIGVRAARTVDQVRALLALYAMAGNVVRVGARRLRALYTPGHAAHHIALHDEEAQVIFAGGAILGPRLQALSKLAAASPEGPLPASLAGQIHDPFTRVALQTYVAVLFGIVFLMTIKPALVWAIIVILMAAALGVLSGLPLMRTARPSMS